MKLKRKLLIIIMINMLLLQKLTSEVNIRKFGCKIKKKANLASKKDIADFVKKQILIINY